MTQREMQLEARQDLRCAFTKAIEESPCSYEVVIRELVHQLGWMYEAREKEHKGPKRITRKQILEGLKKLSKDGKL